MVVERAWARAKPLIGGVLSRAIMTLTLVLTVMIIVATIRSYTVADCVGMYRTQRTGSQVNTKRWVVATASGRLFVQFGRNPVVHSKWQTKRDAKVAVLDTEGTHVHWEAWPPDRALLMRENYGLWSKFGFAMDTVGSSSRSGSTTVRFPIALCLLITATPLLTMGIRRLRRARAESRAARGFPVNPQNN